VQWLLFCVERMFMYTIFGTVYLVVFHGSILRETSRDFSYGP
jgi:hypothetical protein